MSEGSTKVALAALAGNLLIAVSKLVAALLTGSAAMFAETLHSFADCGNQILLLVGLRQSGRPADEQHPFGHGKEQYFWAFLVAIVIFALGAVFSLVEGVRKVIAPHPMENPVVTFVVLGLSLFFEGGSLRVALKEFNAWRGGLPFFEALAQAKDAVTLTVILEDLAALAGLVVALVSVTLAEALHAPVFDGLGSVFIGLLLAAVAYFLASVQRGFLVGRGLTARETAKLKEAVLACPNVAAITNLATMYLGANLLLCADLTFLPGATAEEVIRTIDEVEARLKGLVPGVSHIYLEADGLARRAALTRPTPEGPVG
ncbi:MAG: cation diffusion facilitator family transporter [Chitinophagales bacterium]